MATEPENWPLGNLSFSDYLKWLKSWYEADYSLQTNKDGQILETTPGQNHTNELSKISVTSKSDLFPAVIFGHKRYYSPHTLPLFDDTGEEFPNIFSNAGRNFPSYWDDLTKSRYFDWRQTFNARIGSSFLRNFLNHTFLAKGFSIKDDFIFENSGNSVEIKNCLLNGNIILNAQQSSILRIEASAFSEVEIRNQSSKSVKINDCTLYGAIPLKIGHSLHNFELTKSKIYEDMTVDNAERQITISNSYFHQNLKIIATLQNTEITLTRVNVKNDLIFDRIAEFSVATIQKSNIFGGVRLVQKQGSVAKIEDTKIFGVLDVQNSHLKSLSLLGLKLKNSLLGRGLVASETLFVDKSELNSFNLEDAKISTLNLKSSKINGVFDAQNIRIDRELTIDDIEFEKNLNESYNKPAEGVEPIFPVFTLKNSVVAGVFEAANRKFGAKTSYLKTKFHHPPEFFSSTLHHNTSFEQNVFDMSPPKEKDNHDEYYDNAVRAFQMLKQTMESHRSRTNEAMFFGKELDAKKHLSSIESSEKLLIELYNFTSAYGQSISRVLRSIFLVSLFFFVIYYLMPLAWGKYHGGISSPELIADFFATISFTLEQIFKPFNVWHPTYIDKMGSGSDSVDFWVWVSGANSLAIFFIRLIASVQSLLTAILFALLLIVTRRKFQLN